MLTTLLFQEPLLALVILLTVGTLYSTVLPASNPRVVRLFALCISLTALLLGLLSCLSFDKAISDFQFLYRLDLIPQYNLTLTLGADGFSMVFLLLTLFVFPVCILAG
jgi:NADH-quinone oxidoreductase subunit M